MRFIFSTLLSLLIVACNVDDANRPPIANNKTGVLIDSVAGLHMGDTFLTAGTRVIYDDSQFIESIIVLKSVTDTNRVTREWQEVLYYRFSDLKAGKYLHFYNFSDTAQPFLSGSYYDTTELLSGFNFKSDKSYIPIGPVEKLPDTTIDAVNYGRYSVVSRKRNGIFRFVCFYRYDKKGLPLSKVSKLDSLSDGNPIVKIDSYLPEDDRYPIGSSTFFFDRDTLTESEKQIFKSWAKYLDSDKP